MSFFSAILYILFVDFNKSFYQKKYESSDLFDVTYDLNFTCSNNHINYLEKLYRNEMLEKCILVKIL